MVDKSIIEILNLTSVEVPINKLIVTDLPKWDNIKIKVAKRTKTAP